MKADYVETHSFYGKDFKAIVVKAGEILTGKKIRTDHELLAANDGTIGNFIVDYYKFVVKYRRKPRIKLY